MKGYLVADLAVFEPRINEFNGLLVVADGDDDKILNKGLALLQGLADLKLPVGGVEEVVDVLHVDLHEGDADAPLVGVSSRVQVAEDVVEGQGNQPLVLPLDRLQGPHRVGLPGARLAVYKERTIVALKYVLDDRQAGLLEYFLLVGRLIKDVVKVELVNLVLLVLEGDPIVDQFELPLGELVPHGPYPQAHPDLLLLHLLAVALTLLHHHSLYYANSFYYTILRQSPFPFVWERNIGSQLQSG